MSERTDSVKSFLKGLLKLLVDPVVLCIPIVLFSLAAIWIFGYDSSGDAVGFTIALAMAMLPLCIIGAGLRAAVLTCGVLGVWLAASPFILGFSGINTAAWLVNVLCGFAIAAICGREFLRTGDKGRS